MTMRAGQPPNIVGSIRVFWVFLVGLSIGLTVHAWSSQRPQIDTRLNPPIEFTLNEALDVRSLNQPKLQPYAPSSYENAPLKNSIIQKANFVEGRSSTSSLFREWNSLAQDARKWTVNVPSDPSFTQQSIYAQPTLVLLAVLVLIGIMVSVVALIYGKCRRVAAQAQSVNGVATGS